MARKKRHDKDGRLIGLGTLTREPTVEETQQEQKTLLAPYVGHQMTYKELCEILGWKYATGNTKKAQLKQLDTICYNHKIGSGKGQKISIDGLKYGLDIELLGEFLNEKQLINLIAKSLVEQIYKELQNTQDDFITGSWFVTNKTLSKLVGLRTDSWDYAERNIKAFADTYNLNVEVVKDVMECNRNVMYKSLRSALKKLQFDFHLITWIPSAYILETRQVNVLEDIGDSSVGYSYKRVIYPTLDTIEWINTVAVPNAMHQMGYSSMAQLQYKPHDLNIFYGKVLPQWISQHCLDVDKDTRQPKYSQEIRQLYSVERVWLCHRIGFDREVIETTYNSRRWQMTENDRETMQKIFTQLNIGEEPSSPTVGKVTRIHLIDNLETRHEKAVNGLGKVIEVRSLEEYVPHGKTTIDKTVAEQEYKYLLPEDYESDDKIVRIGG